MFSAEAQLQWAMCSLASGLATCADDFTAEALVRRFDQLPVRDLVELLWTRAPAAPLEASTPLFVLYTSGSTGKPKGMVHTHGGYQVGQLRPNPLEQRAHQPSSTPTLCSSHILMRSATRRHRWASARQPTSCSICSQGGETS